MINKILVPVDGSSVSTRGLEEALRLVKQTQGTLRILHAVDELLMDNSFLTPEHYDQWIDGIRQAGRKVLREAQAFARKRDVDAEPVFIEAIGCPAAEIIIEQARLWPADLIVMGTHGRRGLRRLLMGSDAELVLRKSPVPVMLVREHAESTWTPGAAEA